MSGSVFMFVFLTLMQWAGGYGALASIGGRLPRSLHIPMGLLAGLFMQTLMIYLMDFAGMATGKTNMVIASAMVMLVGNARYKVTGAAWKSLFAKPTFNLHLSEVVILLCSIPMFYTIAWSAWYWPVTPSDAIAGIDLVARQAVIEGHLSNSIYTHHSLQGSLSNQPFYAPFAMLMQVEMWSLGFVSGQLWLILMSFAFAWLMFAWLRREIHPMLASVAWLLMVITPEWFGYQFLLQTDFSNAVFFATGCLLLYQAWKDSEKSHVLVSALFFAAACWSRNETILLLGLVLLTSAYWLKGNVKQLAIVAAAGFATFSLWNIIHVMFVLPVQPDTANELGGAGAGRLATVFGEYFALTGNDKVYFDEGLWGAQPYLYLIAIVASMVFLRRNKSTNWILVAQVGALFVGFMIVGTIFSSAIVSQTLRRATFKLIPLQTMILITTPVMQLLSQRIAAWEQRRRA